MLNNLVTKYWMDEECLAIWSEYNTLRLWLEIEIALAQAQSDLGIIPKSAAKIIAQEVHIDKMDLKSLDQEINVAKHPFVPVLKQIEKMCGNDAGGWLHWGATTQNIFDAAQSIQLKETVEIAISTLSQTTENLKSLSKKHKNTMQAGRTHGQHALPITFGYKVLGWQKEAQRHLARLIRLDQNCFVIRLGGAAGTYAAMGNKGREVEKSLAILLNLSPSDLGTRSDFDLQAEVISVLTMACAFCERVAGDLFFMQRTEIGEIEENHYPERVGSSTMAQKRNPSDAQKTISLARLVRARLPLMMEAMVRADEGDASSTGVTDYSLPEICVLATSTLKSLKSLIENIHINESAMLENLGKTNGLICAEQVMMKLANSIGRGKAHDILHKASANVVENNLSFESAIMNELSSEHDIDRASVKSIINSREYVSSAVDIIKCEEGKD